MNHTVKSQLEHRSIRKFKKETVPKDIIDTLYQVAIQTPTSRGMQSSSIIRITNSTLKMEISEICKQDYVNDIPEFWLFIVDNYRNYKINEERGIEEDGSKNLRCFFQSYIDASIMAQNVEVAAEALGFGSVYFGSIYNDIGRLIDILKLPMFTFPVVGLGFGYPNENPEVKPRIKKDLRIFENSYTIFENYSNRIKDYDEVLTNYYDLRKKGEKSPSFKELVAERLSNSKSIDIIQNIENQGFEIEGYSKKNKNFF